MSYSFSVCGKNKEEVLNQVRAKMAEVVVGQPIHEKDQAAAVTTAQTFIDMLADDPIRDVYASISGSLSWQGENNFTGASVNVSASLVVRKT